MCVFFFFQAEDGIRDLYVTGVQTCALPILDEVADLTPEQHAACEAIIQKDHLTGSERFQPIPADHGIVRFPGGEGGPEWAGGAFDPDLGLFIVNTNNFGYTEKLVPQTDGEWNMVSGRFVDRK